MASLDLNKYTRPENITGTKTFTDELQPGAEITLTLSLARDWPSNVALVEKREKYVTDYIIGRDNNPPAPLPPVDGVQTPLSEAMFGSIAFLEAFEVSDTPYSMFDWIKLAVRFPNAFEDITLWAKDLASQASENSSAKNSQSADTEQS